MGKTINQALKDVFLNLGGDPSELSDNQTVSDYIEDLGGAIEDAAEGAAADIIDDTKKGAKTTYSSNKIESDIESANAPFVVTVTSTSGTVTADKTLAEIAEAIAAGKVVTCTFDLDGSITNNIPLTSTVPTLEGEPDAVVFQLWQLAASIGAEHKSGLKFTYIGIGASSASVSYKYFIQAETT